MRSNLALTVSVFAGLGFTAPRAQELRSGLNAADLVVVATDAGVRPLGSQHVLHRLQVHKTLKGASEDVITVVEWTRLSQHLRPAPGETRLFCLHALTNETERPAGLPADFGPYYKMNGHAGSNPAVAKDRDDDPVLQLARLVLDAEAGRSPRETAEKLCALTLSGTGAMRFEAVRLLTERRALLDAVRELEWSKLLSRAVGESDDIAFKVALAELCAEKKLDGLVNALCVSVPVVGDPRFLRALGRITSALHGEGSMDVLRPHLTGARQADLRGRYLLALGATGTEAARTALLRMRQDAPRNEHVEAALRELGVPTEAAGEKK